MTKENELISVEHQTEYHVASGRKEDRIFVKMYVGAVRSGMIADMGPRNWTTLCTIASFMDKDGKCFPTQERIADALGIRRPTASKWVGDLLEYRWKGQPVIKAEKVREEGRFSHTLYTIMPVSFLGATPNAHVSGYEHGQ